MAGLQRAQDLGMGQPNPVLVSWRGIGVEGEGMIFSDRDHLLLEGSDTQLWTLLIDQNADWTTAFFLKLPDHSDLRPKPIVGGMACERDRRQHETSLTPLLNLPSPVQGLQR